MKNFDQPAIAQALAQELMRIIECGMPGTLIESASLVQFPDVPHTILRVIARRVLAAAVAPVTADDLFAGAGDGVLRAADEDYDEAAAALAAHYEARGMFDLAAGLRAVGDMAYVDLAIATCGGRLSVLRALLAPKN